MPSASFEMVAADDILITVAIDISSGDSVSESVRRKRMRVPNYSIQLEAVGTSMKPVVPVITTFIVVPVNVELVACESASELPPLQRLWP